MRTTTANSRTLRNIAAVAVAAMIAAACGGDEPAVVEPADPVPVEQPSAEPELVPDLDRAPDEPAVEPEPTEAPATTTAESEVDLSGDADVAEAAPEPVEEESSIEFADEPDPEEISADDPWSRVMTEQVLASELWPDGDENGNPYPDDLVCHVPSGGDLECYYTTPEPEQAQPEAQETSQAAEPVEEAPSPETTLPPEDDGAQAAEPVEEAPSPETTLPPEDSGGQRA